MQKTQNYKTLSVREFKDLCDTLSPSRFIFSTENQLWDKADHTISVKLTFSIMLIAFNPNVICFKNSSDYLCLEKVKCIRTDKNKCALGTVFTIICGDFNSNTNDVTYTIIAR